MLTEAQLRKISKTKTPKASLLAAIVAISDEFKPHQLAHVLAQVMHESGGLRFDREIWGPTAAQKKYEGRKDLGNTKKGDGSKYRGYGPIQVTGRHNVTAFRDWCRGRKLNPPDFVVEPAQIATSPWAGWSVVWYWDAGNPTGQSLDRYADINDIEMITRRINGGLNGYDDRLSYYDRASLVLLGKDPDGIKAFQKASGLRVDGVSGPQTRAALHAALVALVPGEAAREAVQTAPVVEKIETTVEKQVVPAKVEEKVKEKSNWLTWLTGGGGLSTIGLGWLTGMNWEAVVAGGVILIVVLLLFILLRSQIISAVREIKAEVG
jgi:putative chitinase